jgi:hypothetical protein
LEGDYVQRQGEEEEAQGQAKLESDHVQRQGEEEEEQG